jgi:peptidoglycan/xylan/chitin deacetylase (PgdA/CDA1 family)
MKRTLARIAVTVAVLFVLAYGLLTLSRATTYQLFGDIVPRVETNEKVVALTFDDGPTPFAREVLQTLAARNVHATFFLIGAQIVEDPADARAIAASGNQIGNHSWSHDRMVFKRPSFIASEIEKTDREIRKAGYVGEIQIRPPYGKKLVGLPWYLARHHRKTIMWDVDPLTDRNVDRSTDRIVEFVLSRVRPGSIVLLHPMYNGREATRDALGPIIDGLHARGFRFVTVNELLAYRGQ